MPRQILECLDQLIDLPDLPEPERYPDDWHNPQTVPAALCEYLQASRIWAVSGLELERELRVELAGVYKKRLCLQPLLRPLMFFYPCEEFRRPLVRAIEQAAGGLPEADYRGWNERFPDVRMYVGKEIERRAGSFNSPDIALPACLAWSRYFDGGEAAWRQFALVLNRARRRGDQLRSWLEPRLGRGISTRADLWCAQLVEGCLLTIAEGERLNAQWTALGWGRLEFPARGLTELDAWRGPARRAAALRRAAAASWAMSGGRWRDADYDAYARALAGTDDALEEPAGLPAGLLERARLARAE